jgi:ribosomal protein L34E
MPKNTVAKKDLTLDILKQHLEMDTKGNLVWLHDTPKAKKGAVAGMVREKDGYHSIVLLGTNYSGKQLKAFYQTGSWSTFYKRTPEVSVTITKEKKAKVTKPKAEKKKKIQGIITDTIKVKPESTAKSIAQKIAEAEAIRVEKKETKDLFWEDENN